MGHAVPRRNGTAVLVPSSPLNLCLGSLLDAATTGTTRATRGAEFPVKKRILKWVGNRLWRTAALHSIGAPSRPLLTNNLTIYFRNCRLATAVSSAEQDDEVPL